MNKVKQGIHLLCHMVLSYFLERRDSLHIKITWQQKPHHFEHFLERKHLVEKERRKAKMFIASAKGEQARHPT